MKTTLRILIILLSFAKLSAQTENLTSSKYQFAKDVFEKKYSKQNFQKFKGKIVIDSNSIKFDEKTLVLYNVKNVYKPIFTDGIFYPNIITGNHIAIIKSKEEIDSMATSERVFYNMMRTDSLTIGYFDELKALNPSPKIKRFIFWLHSPGRANPTEYYFELENEKATKKTTLPEFIKNSKLTFFYRGTLII